MRKFIGKSFIKLMGWKIDPNLPKEALGNCVLIAAPHTSNWDYPFAIAAMATYGIRIRYTIKKEWMKFPLNLIFGPLGGIGIDRSPKKKGEKRRSMVDSIASLFEEGKNLCVMVPAEGSRSLRDKWKTGFYYIAKQANVPIVLGYLDYEKKIGGIGKVIYPSDNMEKDMHEIMMFFKDMKGRYPEKFVLDKRYYPMADNQSDQEQTAVKSEIEHDESSDSKPNT